MNGEVRVVDDVARAFADVVEAERPVTFALSGGETARGSRSAFSSSPGSAVSFSSRSCGRWLL